MLELNEVACKIVYTPAAMPLAAAGEDFTVVGIDYLKAVGATAQNLRRFAIYAGANPALEIYLRDATSPSTNMGIFCQAFNTAGASVNATTTGVNGALPLDEWILWWVAWDATAKTLRCGFRSESQAELVSTASSALAGTPRLHDSGGTPISDIAIGNFSDHASRALSSAFMAQQCIFEGVIANTGLGGFSADADLIWSATSSGSAAKDLFDYHRQMRGSFSGLVEPRWSFSHGHVSSQANVVADGTAVDGNVVASTSNLVIANEGGSSIDTSVSDSLWDQCPAAQVAVTGSWTHRNPFAAANGVSGDFEPQLVSIAGVPDPPYIAGESQDLVDIGTRSYGGRRIRVLALANSREHAQGSGSGDERNRWSGAFGDFRKADLCGMLTAPYDAGNGGGSISHLRFFENGWLEVSGTIYDTADFCSGTSDARASFGNFGSHHNNAASTINGGYIPQGNVVTITAGAIWRGGGKPQAGTKFTAQTQPLTFGHYLLMFPGAGTATWAPRRVATSISGTATALPGGASVSLDTTTIERAFTVADTYTATGTGTLELDGTDLGITTEYGVYISAGTGAGSITEVTGVSEGASTTTLTLKRPFIVAPDTADSVFKLGPLMLYAAVKVDDVGTTDAYRAVDVQATDGDVHVVACLCEAHAEEGVVYAGFCLNSAGYAQQLARMFNPGGENLYIKAFDPDVAVTWIANQGSTVADQDAMLDLIAATVPTCDLVAALDPQYRAHQDDWHADAFTTISEGRIVIDVSGGAGIGDEFHRLLIGGWGDGTHPDGLGMNQAWTEFFALVADGAATPAPPSESSGRRTRRIIQTMARGQLRRSA